MKRKVTLVLVSCLLALSTFMTSGIVDATNAAMAEGTSKTLGTAQPKIEPTNTPLTMPSITRTLKKGLKGQDVKYLQIRLLELGYAIGTADGIFGTNTYKAVVNYQIAKKLEADGVVGAVTCAMLWSVNIQPTPTVKPSFTATPIAATPTKTPVKTNTPAPTPTIPGAPTRNLAKGSRGDDVKWLQSKLIQYKFLVGKADGIFGAITESALIAFQKANKILANGIAGTSTYLVMSQGQSLTPTPKPTPTPKLTPAITPNKTNTPIPTSTPKPTQAIPGAPTRNLAIGSRGDDVKLLQSKLIAYSYLTGKADGIFGALTEKALIAFQQLNKILANGIAGPSTYVVMFQGQPVTPTPKPTPAPTPTPKPTVPPTGKYKYYVKVDITNQVVSVYGKDQAGYYTKIVKQMICSSGTGNNTPLGIFRSQGPVKRWGHFDDYNVYAQYWFRINGGILFHSILYTARDESKLIVSTFNALGSKASHGCVRLMPQDAKWIYENVEIYSTVEIYKGIKDSALTARLKPIDINGTLPTPTPKPTPAPTATPKPTPVPTATPKPTPVPTATPKATPVPEPEPTATIVPEPEPTATIVPEPEPTATIVPEPESTATIVPET